MELLRTGCCAVLELKDISTHPTPEAIINDAIKQLQDDTIGWYHKKPFITFTGVITRYKADHASNRPDNYGLDLANYIKTHNLGEIIDSIPAKANWSKNVIQMWVWIPDYTAIIARYKVNRNAVV